MALDWNNNDGIYLPMINDAIRNQFYEKIIAKAVNGKSCTDVGFGTGFLSILALKHDVAEELERISFHLKSLKNDISLKKVSGKKIDFILQELFRETNTLSVKLDDPTYKKLGLESKLLVEEMREQIQNVE